MTRDDHSGEAAFPLDLADRKQLEDRGVSPGEFQTQLRRFASGFPPVELIRPVRPEEGITSLDPGRIQDIQQKYGQALDGGRVMKFVPASGAASRMFQSLLFVLNSGLALPTTDPASADPGNPHFQEFARFVENLPRFAFHASLIRAMKEAGHEPASLLEDGDLRPLLRTLLTGEGLAYAELPKGLVEFHRQGDAVRTAFAEQLVEAAGYSVDGQGRGKIHFTVPASHRSRIEAHLQECTDEWSVRGIHFEIDFSEQMNSTDTIAVDSDDQPLRDGDGRLLFRPGGHGSLLANLAMLDGDIVFMKNIDNVAPDHLKADTFHFKKILGGLLVDLQQRIFECIGQLEDSGDPGLLEDIRRFVVESLCFRPPTALADAGNEEKREFLLSILDRPLRVCGVVRNEGEPGGGPFWVEGRDGSQSLQIVESSQIDHSDPIQRKIFEKSTHFNPVDLVCGLRDHRGNAFDLDRFVEPEMGIITTKSKDGQTLKALERPGLWNGAMARWNTVFVEVPLSTFSPVKTVMDLLRPAHQPEGS